MLLCVCGPWYSLNQCVNTGSKTSPTTYSFFKQSITGSGKHFHCGAQEPLSWHSVFLLFFRRFVMYWYILIYIYEMSEHTTVFSDNKWSILQYYMLRRKFEADNSISLPHLSIWIFTHNYTYSVFEAYDGRVSHKKPDDNFSSEPAL